jgi:YkoY family integral membrane protein
MGGIDAAGWTTILGAIFSLVLLEGLLSADNALVLAVMVRHLPRIQQKRALRYGIWGAFVFRLIAVIFASILLKFWWLKVLGGLYLLFLALRHFLGGASSGEGGHARPRVGSGFWATVVNVEIADIAFSIDSILAAVALAEKLPPNVEHATFALPLLGNVPLPLLIVYLGGVLGIIAMRLVAGVFLVLLDRFKGLAEGAYLLVAWIGVGLVETGLIHALNPRPPTPPGTWRDSVPAWVKSIPEMPEWLFWSGMVAIIVLSLLYKPKERRGGSAEPPGEREGEVEQPAAAPAGGLPEADGPRDDRASGR